MLRTRHAMMSNPNTDALRQQLASCRSMARSRNGFAAEKSSLPGSYGDSAAADVRMFKTAYKTTDLTEIFKKCRHEATYSNFVNWVLYFKGVLFNDGFRVPGADAAHMPALRRIANDVWTEYLINDNAVCFWTPTGSASPSTGSAAELPVVQVFDCEDVDYDNSLGIESVTLRFNKKIKLTGAQKAQLPERYVKALEEGRLLVLDEDEDEFFRVLTLQKVGKGLAVPRLRAAFDDLSTLALLGKGDWNAAWTMKDVIRQIKKGHQVTGGNLAGMPVHFMKSEEKDLILKGLQGKTGAFDVVSNFDVDIMYPLFDPKFFSEDKYKGTLMKLIQWSGPVGLLFHSDLTRSLEDLIPIVQAEADYHRLVVASHLESIFNDPNFSGMSGLKVEFSPVTFVTVKNVLAYVTAGVTNGLMSPQTGQTLMRLNGATEAANMTKARARKQDFTPVFEAKQGLLQGEAPTTNNPNPETGGRPAKK